MNSLLISLAVVYALMGSCRQTWNTPEHLAKKYENAPESYEALKKMSREDKGDRTCFEVGLDHIGDYWETGGEWSSNAEYRKKLTLPEVLASSNISESRFEEYRKQFSKAGAERVSSCGSPGQSGTTVVLIFRTGWLFAGCSATVEWSATPVLPEGKRGDGEFSEVTPMGKNWYLVYECN